MVLLFVLYVTQAPPHVWKAPALDPKIQKDKQFKYRPKNKIDTAKKRKTNLKKNAPRRGGQADLCVRCPVTITVWVQARRHSFLSRLFWGCKLPQGK